MKKTKFIGISIFSSLALALGGMHAISAQKPKVEAKADGETVVTSDFGYDAVNQTYGVYEESGKHRYLYSGSESTGNINNASLSLFNSSSELDEAITFEYSGNNSNYAKGNELRDYSSNGPYLQLRYPGTVDGVGGAISIAPSSTLYKVVSISITGHARGRTADTKLGTGESYHKITVNDETTYASYPDLFNSNNSYTYTWSDEDGISSFEFGISLKQSTVGSTEKYICVGSVSVSYIEVGNVSTVTFDTQGGSEVSSQYITNGLTASQPANPTKESSGSTKYTFKGWYTTSDGDTLFDFNSAINEDTTIYAQWTEETAQLCTITFNSNGGTSVDSLEVYEGSEAVKPTNPTKSTTNSDRYCYTFAGWYTDAELESAYDWTSLVSENITLYAKWSYSLIDNTPSGRTHYTINSNQKAWANTDNFTNDAFYTDVDLYSRDTFDASGTKEPILMHFDRNDSSHGFMVHKVYSLLVHTCVITISVIDTSKVITYARMDFGQWGTYNESARLNLYANDDETASDTETAPLTSGETTHYVEASFDATDYVKSIRIVTANYRLSLSNLYLNFEADPSIAESVAYATDFNAANVCGTSDTDGFDASKWAAQKTAYESLSAEAQSYLASYSGDDEEIVECLERYDRIVYLYGESYDFMGRIELGKVTPKENSSSIALNNESGNVALFACVAAVGVAAFAALAIAKKKHKEE